LERRILVVEDETAFADVVSDLLVEEGYAVVHAREAATALNMLASDHLAPDLIVCDVMMPGMRGDQLAVEVRRRFHNRRLPMVLMSASVDPAVTLRDVVFLSKPLEVRTFLATIQRLLSEPQRRGAATPS
jgi:CheY-like chemotaxis protein